MARLFEHEGPIGIDRVFDHGDDRESGIVHPLRRYADEIIEALAGGDLHGFVLGLLGEWGSGKTSAMLILSDLVAQRLEHALAGVGGTEVEVCPWPQEPLARAISVRCRDTTYHPVTTSVLRAPLSLRQDQHENARLDLALTILYGLPERMHEAVVRSLSPGYQIQQADSPEGRKKVTDELRRVLGERQATGDDVERWIREAREDYLSAMEGAAAPEILRRHVHITMLDDLDRADLRYTAQILNAVRFWVDTKGMFFVIASSARYLGEAAVMAMPPGLQADAGTAVQKFVHHDLRMPMLLETTDDAARYWRALLGRTAGPADLPGRGVIEAALEANEPLGLLAPLLSPRVVDLSLPVTALPREAKRRYNALLGILVNYRDDPPDWLKRNIAEMMWRDAWDRFVHPGLNEPSGPGRPPGPRARALDTGIGLAAGVLAENPDGGLEEWADRLARLAAEARFTLDGVPPTLLLYLASDPPLQWSPVAAKAISPVPDSGRMSDTGGIGQQERRRLFEPGGPVHGAAFSPEALDEDGALPAPAAPDADGILLKDTRLEREASNLARDLSLAAAEGDARTARRLTAQIQELLARPDARGKARQTAPTIGNAALRLESADAELAWELHRLAHSLDPDHPNVRLNLAEFLLDYAQGEAAWTEVERQLDWLLGNAPGERPERQLALRARLAQARGEQAKSRELIEEFLSRSGRPDAPFEQVGYAVMVLRDLKARARMEEFVRDRLELRLPGDQGGNTYRLLRMLGDELIEETGELEARGTDMLRHLVAAAFCPDEQSVADVLNNLALIYNTRRDARYAELAGLLWLHALALAPGDQVIRQAYGRYLERRDVETARRLQLGRPVDLPRPAEGEVRRIAAGLPPHMSEGPWWWEAFTPPEPARGFAELAIASSGG